MIYEVGGMTSGTVWRMGEARGGGWVGLLGLETLA